MRLPRHRRSLAASAALVAVLSAGGCATSFSAPTNQQYQPGIGADSRDTPVQVLAGLVVTGADGSATISATLINSTDTDQRLTSVTLATTDGTELEVVSEATDDLVLAPGESRALGRVDDETQDRQSKVYTTTGIDPVGVYYTLTLTFADAGEITIDIPAVRRNAMYADVALPPGADASENELAPGQTPAEKNADEKAGDDETDGEDNAKEDEESGH